MKKKIVFYSELCYVFGILFLCFGCAFMEKADFGLSMVVVPAYLLFRKLSETFSFLTFGVMEYIFQAFLLILMSITIRRFRLSYLFSFVTAVIYGYTLNLCMYLVSFAGEVGTGVRILFYLTGMVFCSIGVACMLHTYISAEVYELIVKEVPSRFGWDLTRFKTIYDCVSCLVGIILSFSFFGLWHFEGVKWGTVICALVNGFLIGRFSGWMDRHLDNRDLFPLRRYFE